MALELIDTTAREVLDLLKSEYYEQTGQTIQIGSDEFASSAVQAYVWPILFNTINNATLNRFIDYAKREYLDAIAANYGIESRPDGYHATAKFDLIPAHVTIDIPVQALIVQDEYGNQFTNKYNLSISETNRIRVLEAVNSGAKYNGIPANKITDIVSGEEFVIGASNVTMTEGGTDGFPYTDDGDDLYRTWLKNLIKSYSGAGTATAYEGRAYNADPRVIDVQVINQEDPGYVKGKVQIYILTDKDTDLDNQVVYQVQQSCADPSFRPIGDLVEVDYAEGVDLTLQNVIQVSYPVRFIDLATQRHIKIINKYKDILSKEIGRPFVFEEFCAMLKEKDEDGVYATDAKPILPTSQTQKNPIYPGTGKYINLLSVAFDNVRDLNAD